jgi:pyridoxamine 5'-phosphate oxidase
VVSGVTVPLKPAVELFHITRSPSSLPCRAVIMAERREGQARSPTNDTRCGASRVDALLEDGVIEPVLLSMFPPGMEQAASTDVAARSTATERARTAHRKAFFPIVCPKRMAAPFTVNFPHRTWRARTTPNREALAHDMGLARELRLKERSVDNETETTLTESQFEAGNSPFSLFEAWFAEAQRAEINDPNAMALATVDETGLPNVRMVLLKGWDARGFVFYTNLESAKGRELLSNMKAAMVMHWKSLRRQVRVRGDITRVSDAEADEYYASRARGSRIGAWASKQSRPLEGRFALEKAVAEYTARYAVGDIPRPEHWSGFCINPVEIEFWQDRKFRLHDRFRFTRDSVDGNWVRTRLYP